MPLVKNVAVAAILAGLAVTGCTTAGNTYDKPGFATEVKDGRLWVFKADAKEYQEFKAQGELTKQVTRIGEGPNGMTLKAPDAKTMDEYLAAK